MGKCERTWRTAPSRCERGSCQVACACVERGQYFLACVCVTGLRGRRTRTRVDGTWHADGA
eukprot:618490-Prymnesium_polylepis.1